MFYKTYMSFTAFIYFTFILNVNCLGFVSLLHFTLCFQSFFLIRINNMILNNYICYVYKDKTFLAALKMVGGSGNAKSSNSLAYGVGTSAPVTLSTGASK